MQNQPQWDYLTKRWQQNNLPHALLLIGGDAADKLLFANKFAKTVLCAQKVEAGCGECRHCSLIQAGSHPDLYHLQPEEQGKAIRIDQIRELIIQLNQTAQQNSYKITIIEPAHALNQAAANALLKTLEEPSGDNLILLLSDQPSLLPATIRSRCQTVRFPAPTESFALTDEQHELLMTLNNIAANQQDPTKAAASWSKSSLNEVIDDAITVVMKMIRTDLQSPLFLFLDKLYETKRYTLRSNPNQQLLLEDLFLSWYQHARTQ